MRQRGKLSSIHVKDCCKIMNKKLLIFPDPSRVSVLTGRYHERSGYRMTHTEKTSSHQEPWLAKQLRDGGYNTVAFGKWHLGDKDFKVRGFNKWTITALGGWSDYYDYQILPVPRNVF